MFLCGDLEQIGRIVSEVNRAAAKGNAKKIETTRSRRPSEGVRVAFIVEDGAPIEFIQFL